MKKAAKPVLIDDLFEDLRDGLRLIDLLTVICPDDAAEGTIPKYA